METVKRGIVFTNKARCRDCYRCVRMCPVKAIRMREGQAFVVEERCIACGTCIRECPQGAKSYRDDVDRAARLVAGGGPVAASVAPSFAALFNEWERKRLPSALRKLGFRHVAETAVGAFTVAQATAEAVRAAPGRPQLCTACPAVVSLIEQYHPDLAGALVPVCSPMIAHARQIRARLGAGAGVVFIGPCVAKKAEAERPEHAGAVDVALTFAELTQWFEREGIVLKALEESRFDEEPAGASRHFPLVGGLARTAALSTDHLATDVIAVSGHAEIVEALEDIRARRAGVLVEALFCPQGCVNGPALPVERGLFSRRADLLAFATNHPGRPDAPAGDVGARFAAAKTAGLPDVTEEQIQRFLEATGKGNPDDRLNCGSCGYPSCRDKAIAVLQGMAEPEMCIPRMRRLAEQRTDRIIETSPNGIVILDERLGIVHMNPAFARHFMCSESVYGRHISYLMDPDLFERLASGGAARLEAISRHPNYGIVCHQIAYRLPEEKQYVGIFIDITNLQAGERKLNELRAETYRQARDLLDHQIQMAQRMAQFLGESTARGEELVENLMKLTGEEGRKS